MNNILAIHPVMAKVNLDLTKRDSKIHLNNNGLSNSKCFSLIAFWDFQHLYTHIYIYIHEFLFCRVLSSMFQILHLLPILLQNICRRIYYNCFSVELYILNHREGFLKGSMNKIIILQYSPLWTYTQVFWIFHKTMHKLLADCEAILKEFRKIPRSNCCRFLTWTLKAYIVHVSWRAVLLNNFSLFSVFVERKIIFISFSYFGSLWKKERNQKVTKNEFIASIRDIGIKNGLFLYFSFLLTNNQNDVHYCTHQLNSGKESVVYSYQKEICGGHLGMKVSRKEKINVIKNIILR